MLTTLAQPLTMSSPQGASQALALISSNNLSSTLQVCPGCTFFIPDDNAFAAANLTALSATQKTDVLLNHVGSFRRLR